MTIEELKEKTINKELEYGLFSSDDKVVYVFENGFTILTLQDNGWTRNNTYEFDKGNWIESEMYEK